MTKTLLLWVFLLINILMFSATGSTFTTKGNKRKSKHSNYTKETINTMQYMKPAFRNAAFYCHAFSRSLTLNSNPLHLVSPFGRPQTFRLAPPISCFSSLMASSLEKQFDDFRVQFEESGTLRERIRSVVSEIESSTRLIYVTLLLVHQSRPTPELLEKAKSQVNVLKKQYHGDWKSETQPVVSMLTFMHWLETGSLLEHKEAEEKLGLNNSSEFGLDVEDYLIHEPSKYAGFLQEVVTNLNMIFILKNMGMAVRISRVSKAKELNNQMCNVSVLCLMNWKIHHDNYTLFCHSFDFAAEVCGESSDCWGGDYDCLRKVLKFLTDLHAAFRMLNFRNDFLRKKFDALLLVPCMKYDLRKLEEVYYDVKIRGLTPNGESVGNLEILESKDNLKLKL
ncbi:Translin [Glycine max]|nr:Translin [Glycine max]